ETEHAARLDITVDGVKLPTLLDTGHVLTTGGSDLAIGGQNESLNWRLIATTGISNPGGANITINVSPPGSQFAAGSAILLSGQAHAEGLLPNGRPDSVAGVELNGGAVDVLDASGRFFASVVVNPGLNRFEFFATDAAGNTAESFVEVTGTQLAPGSVDFSRFA